MRFSSHPGPLRAEFFPRQHTTVDPLSVPFRLVYEHEYLGFIVGLLAAVLGTTGVSRAYVPLKPVRTGVIVGHGMDREDPGGWSYLSVDG